MSLKRLIGACLGAFVLFVGVPWTYLVATNEDVSPQRVRSVAPHGDRARVAAAALSQGGEAQLRATGATRRSLFPRPRVPGVRQRLARLAERLDDEAVKLRLDLGRTALVQWSGAMEAMERQQPEEALRRFERMLVTSPDDPAALGGRAAALVALGRLEEALAAYERLVVVAPQNATARYNYGVLLYRLSRYGDAAEQFRQVVRIDRDHDRAWYNLATLAQRDGRLTEAREAWLVFTRLRPDVASGWFNLGVTLMDFDEPLVAAWSFSSAVAVAPTDADALVNLGLAYASAGSFEDALMAMVRAEEVSPCDPVVASARRAIEEAAGRGEAVVARDGLTLDSH